MVEILIQIKESHKQEFYKSDMHYEIVLKYM